MYVVSESCGVYMHVLDLLICWHHTCSFCCHIVSDCVRHHCGATEIGQLNTYYTTPIIQDLLLISRDYHSPL